MKFATWLGPWDLHSPVTGIDHLRVAYAYHGSRLYFDWARRHWRVLPDPKAHPEASFAEWLETLVHTGDADSLNGILELTHDALSRIRSQPLASGIKP